MRESVEWYQNAYAEASLRQDAIDGLVQGAQAVARGRDRYLAIQEATLVPWWWVGFVHLRESSCDFSCHLHNGDPLSGRTVHVPKGRPVKGQPPFTWEESAKDALWDTIKGPTNWSIGGALRAAERWNGWGYADVHQIPSPYVWAGTTVQKPGKYVGDGNWSSEAFDTQPGVAGVLKILVGMGEVEL